MLYGSSLLATRFMRSGVCVLTPHSSFIPAPFTLVTTGLFVSQSVSVLGVSSLVLGSC